MSEGRGASPARRRAVEVLEGFFASRRPIDWDGALRHLSPADRDLARELAAGVLRHRMRLDAEIGACLRAPIARLQKPLREILEISLYQLRHLSRIPARAAVHEAVELARARCGERAARLTNAVLRRLLRETPDGLEPGENLSVDHSHPAFLVERWLARFGRERTLTMLRANNERPAMDLLVHAGRVTRGELADRLAREGVATRPLAISPLGLRVDAGNPIDAPAFSEGLFYVADGGSQALPRLLPIGEALLDLAAAPGGKSIAALVSGRVRRAIACDAEVSRAARVLQNRRRLELPGLCTAAMDLRLPALPAGRFDRVLLDAPCSGTGILRKSPELRYRLTPSRISALSRRQADMLEAAARLVAPGGYLLYATCSLEAEENEEIVSGFLSRDRGFAPAQVEAPPELAPHVEGARLRLFPDAETDGFTAHLLRRGN